MTLPAAPSRNPAAGTPLPQAVSGWIRGAGGWIRAGAGPDDHAAADRLTAASGDTGNPRAVIIGETNRLDASADLDFRPDHALVDGEVVHGDGWAIEAVLTPGHAANHTAFALRGTGLLFSADHVMAWSTSIVAPPDGAMVWCRSILPMKSASAP